VLENVSDAYELSIGPGSAEPGAELEPNDTRESATAVAPGETARGRIAWMRDVDVYCATGADPVRFIVDDPMPRVRGAVLEVTPLGPGGPGMPVRVHHATAKGAATDRDVKSPMSTAKHKSQASTCVSITLTGDIWAEPPLPRVAPAGDQEYTVQVERL
jgi:hypothetical protein